MDELNADGFATFFQALWDMQPFAWQRELARRVLENDDSPWPEAIALPTAAGKTACMDIAVYALAAQAGRLNTGLALTAPRRIFFVVDRRVIVNEAHTRAQCLALRLQFAQDGIVKDVADRLRYLTDGDVASTVDQLGSRLLFRAYGPGIGMRPIHAGLVGNDSLILLDEAHCAQPFLETLQAVKRYRSCAEAPLQSPFHVTVMSATPPKVKDVFVDVSGEGGNPNHPLGQRQLAHKPARLVVAEKAKGKNADLIREELAKSLAAEALNLVNQWCQPNTTNQPDLFAATTLPKPAVVVFCNRVDTARSAHRLLAGQGKQAILLTGRMRPIDKDDTVDGDLAKLSAGNVAKRRLDEPYFVVTTQTLEVGANLDFDLLVTECTSLDALRQRFGRLNRTGRNIQACGAIVARADQTEKSDDDPVYGVALANTWRWLKRQADGNDQIDFGISHLAPRLQDPDAIAELNAPAQHAPILLPSHLDALSQTSPEPWPSPDVALFLHGPRSGPADVQVCWRADLDGDETTWSDTINLCPPTSPECLTVPIGQMRRWLAGAPSPAGADVEGEAEGGAPTDSQPAPGRKVLRWCGRGKVETLTNAAEVRPGDVLVIPAKHGGWMELATLGDKAIADWADRAQTMMRGKAFLRLHLAVLSQWPESAPLRHLRALAESGARILEEDAGALTDDLRTALADWSSTLKDPKWAWLNSIVTRLARDKELAKGISVHPTHGLVLKGTHRIEVQDEDAERFNDEDDEASSGRFRSYLLDPIKAGKCHLEGVAEYAARHARQCGLPAALVDILESAGRGHDLGKADPRFQAWLNQGNPWARGPLLAKSEGMAQSRRAESAKARMRAGYPEGGRHELLSVRLLESLPNALPEDQTLHDLLLHLVESHHGYCRPFAPAIDDAEPIQVSVTFNDKTYAALSATGLERLDAGPAARFWYLTRRYGWWGLAWLEALLRLADHRRSEWEEWRTKESNRG